MNILDFYQDDIDGRAKPVSGSKEWRGPCPVCGGDDRFGVWPEQDKFGTFYCGRGRSGGNGCEIGGDAIQYLIDVRKYAFKEACELLGVPTKASGSSYRYKSVQLPKTRRNHTHVPRNLGYPEEVVDPQMWHEHGMKFVNRCHEALLKRPTSITYLMARGISMESIKKYKLGFHHGEERNGKELQPSFRPWPSWGMKNEKRAGSNKSRMILLPAGLVIPYIVDGMLHRITIRLVKPDPKQPKKKYHYVRGSIRDVWLSNPRAKVFVLQEAELDCIAVDEAAGDLVGTLGLGSTGIKPDVRAAKALEGSLCILGALDFDQPNLNPKTGKNERPGAKAGEWWRKQYSQYRRWPVYEGKDAGDAYQAGVDLREWIVTGLPPALQEEKTSPPVPMEIATLNEPAPANNDDRPGLALRELTRLLSEGHGFIRVYKKGMGIGIEVPPSWSVKFPEKRRRMTELVFSTGEVGRYIESLEDGVYSSHYFLPN